MKYIHQLCHQMDSAYLLLLQWYCSGFFLSLSILLFCKDCKVSPFFVIPIFSLIVVKIFVLILWLSAHLWHADIEFTPKFTPRLSVNWLMVSALIVCSSFKSTGNRPKFACVSLIPKAPRWNSASKGELSVYNLIKLLKYNRDHLA